ncbi:MAG: AtpZ/AtpI family protein [Terracidiphilus sp.]
MPYQRPIPGPIPETKKPGKTTPGLQSLVEVEKLMQIAILLPVTALVGGLAGAWLDERLHQSWMGVMGVLLGGVAGLVYVIQLALAAGKTSEGQDGGTGPNDVAGKSGSRGKTE